jgi:hypothetical protein
MLKLFKTPMTDLQNKICSNPLILDYMSGTYAMLILVSKIPLHPPPPHLCLRFSLKLHSLRSCQARTFASCSTATQWDGETNAYPFWGYLCLGRMCWWVGSETLDGWQSVESIPHARGGPRLFPSISLTVLIYHGFLSAISVLWRKTTIRRYSRYARTKTAVSMRFPQWLLTKFDVQQRGLALRPIALLAACPATHLRPRQCHIMNVAANIQGG